MEELCDFWDLIGARPGKANNKLGNGKLGKITNGFVRFSLKLYRFHAKQDTKQHVCAIHITNADIRLHTCSATC
jgi:hypothetical protein